MAVPLAAGIVASADAVIDVVGEDIIHNIEVGVEELMIKAYVLSFCKRFKKIKHDEMRFYI